MTHEQQLLGVALSAAVPLHILEVRRLSPDARAARALECARIISFGERNDEMRGQHGAGPALLANGELARGPNAGGPGKVFDALAEGLALASFLPGGSRYLDLHWESQ